MSCLLSQFLTRAHLLLESIQGTRLLFTARVYFWSLVELTIDKLALIEIVAMGLLPMGLEGYRT
jgi:hypothetical protein